jgi:hypothetical protein
VSDSNHSKNSSSGADEKFSTKVSVASRNALLRHLALFVATFGGVIPIADNLREMFGRRDVGELRDCSDEPIDQDPDGRTAKCYGHSNICAVE